MADKNNFTKQELNTLVAETLVEVKEVKSGIDEIKKEIILDKESRVKWLSEIRNEVKSLIRSKENLGSTNEIFNLESQECQALIDAISFKIYKNIMRWADEKTNANRTGGKITINEYLQKIYDQQTDHIEQYNMDRDLWLSINAKKKDASQRKISNRITELKNKIRTIYNDNFPLWIRNPYKASALLFFGIYFCLSCFSWIRWHQYRSENLRLQQIEAKYEVDKAIIQELSPQLSITLYGYEKLTDQLGKEEIVEIFKDKIQELNSKKAP
ncbi:MAG: hypothetical protein J1F67_03775 [Muribaculaceae bacterium]|nr:hypothetical protein [Muribaculaceae bacterium]